MIKTSKKLNLPTDTKAQLQEWFADVVSYVEGVRVPPNHFDDLNVEQLKERIAFYELGVKPLRL